MSERQVAKNAKGNRQDKTVELRPFLLALFPGDLAFNSFSSI
jgi:hypothetical protein